MPSYWFIVRWVLLRHRIRNIRIHPSARYRIRYGFIFSTLESGFFFSGFAVEFAGYVWTVAVSGKKKLRTRKYPNTCGLGLKNWTSVFYASVLLLTMNFVVDIVKVVVDLRGDSWVDPITNCEIVRSRSLTHCIITEFSFVCLQTIKLKMANERGRISALIVKKNTCIAELIHRLLWQCDDATHCQYEDRRMEIWLQFVLTITNSKSMCLSAYWQWKVANQRLRLSAVIVKWRVDRSTRHTWRLSCFQNIIPPSFSNALFRISILPKKTNSNPLCKANAFTKIAFSDSLDS